MSVEQIERLLLENAEVVYEGDRAEPVSSLAHALQCAQLAEWAGAPAPLVAAALLHDIGHFIETVGIADDIDDVHEARAQPLLMRVFGPAVAEPVRWHVAAKRYLVAVDVGYAAQLTPASVHSLGLQGGAMTAAEAAAFEALPFAQDAIALRRWDDQAKLPGQVTPGLDYYLALLNELRLAY
ncbi:phosphohydrolase [Paucibacter sp. TC2R-5]|uniref:phosphohydrolase n=1 Tax=Paucibacter sp. TC2R-5 TaxID=2893555 RepID=UPI002961EC82|nr:phosphohydrolase [Paucibacter sp. TC2R-5]